MSFIRVEAPMIEVEEIPELAPISRQRDDASSIIYRLTHQSPLHTLRLVYSILWAKWNLRKATSVGKYVKLAGRLRIINQGRLVVEDRVLFNSYHDASQLVIQKGGELHIGKGVFINYGADICALKYVSIGEESRIGTHCIIMDSDFHHIELGKRHEKPTAAATILEPHTWIGNRVTILKGVRIGYGSVVAAGSVVTRSIPPMAVAAGVPAKVIRRIDESQPGGE